MLELRPTKHSPSPQNRLYKLSVINLYFAQSLLFERNNQNAKVAALVQMAAKGDHSQLDKTEHLRQRSMDIEDFGGARVFI